MVVLLTLAELYALMEAARRSHSYGFSAIYGGDYITHAWMADVDGWYTVRQGEEWS